MKPILFSASANSFTTNGLGTLEPSRCVVTEEINGQYELECEVSVDSPHFSDIANNMILVVKPGDGGSFHNQADRQAFRIYSISEPLSGIVTINARHISYDLSYNTVMPFTASGITAAFDSITSHAVETLPFTFQTDKTTAGSFNVTTPQTIRSILGGQQGSILNTFGGEYQWNNYIVQLWNHRGTDANTTLRYGKNITDVRQEQNIESVITGIVPYWADQNQTVTLTEKSVDSAYASQYPFKRTVPVDFSSDFQNAPSESDLRSRAQAYITANNIGIPKVSIGVSFVALWQTEEYKDVALLERVHLGDTVGVVFEKYGINTRAEVVKTVWDCLSERYLSIELGEVHANMASTLVKMDADQTQALEDTKTNLERAIEVATDWLTNADSHVYIVEDENTGSISEFLFVNGNQPIQTATQVMRLNAAGLGFSKNGVNGPFTNAFVFDSDKGGHLVADFITAGTMLADRIQGGTLESIDSTTISGVTYKNFSLNMTTGAIEALKLSIKSANFTLTENGEMSCTGATINGTLTSTTGDYKTVIEDGTIRFYYGSNLASQIKGAISGINTIVRFSGIYGEDVTVDIIGRLDADVLYVNGRGVSLQSGINNGQFSVTAEDSISLDATNGLTLTGYGIAIGSSGNTDAVNIYGDNGIEAWNLLSCHDGIAIPYGGLSVGGVSGWGGTINGVSDGNGHYGDITVSNGVITGWSGWY